MIALLVLAAICLFVNLAGLIIVLGLNLVMMRDLRDILTFEKVNTGRINTIDHTTLAIQIAQTLHAARSYLPSLPNQSLVDPHTSSTDATIISEKFETSDGKHSASSLKELMEKINEDPTYNVGDPQTPPVEPTPDTKGLEDLFNAHMDSSLKDIMKKVDDDLTPPTFTPDEQIVLDAGDVLPCNCYDYPVVWRCPLHRKPGTDGHGDALTGDETPDAQ